MAAAVDDASTAEVTITKISIGSASEGGNGELAAGLRPGLADATVTLITAPYVI